MSHVKSFKFHKGYSSLDKTTTKRLTRIAKNVIEQRLSAENDSSNQRIVEGLIKMNSRSFFNIIDFKYSITDPGAKEILEGHDTGKQIFTAVFKEENSRPYQIKLHWVLLRGLGPEANAITTFYDEPSSDE